MVCISLVFDKLQAGVIRCGYSLLLSYLKERVGRSLGPNSSFCVVELIL